MITVLGVSCSLRNARFGAGSESLTADIKTLYDETALKSYLAAQTHIRANDFIEAGRKQGLPFDKIYGNLRKAKGDQGLSNSEAALAAGLWGAHQAGADIKHCGLSQFFPMKGPGRNLNKLRELVLAADALLISGPVYFGDRGSQAQAFFEFLHSDEQCAEHLRGRVYGGIAVGAKRNGGQETNLIYQIIDSLNLNMLAVGNDSKTSGQYGGTAWAGDVGTLADDDYGINTSVGTGRRIVTVARKLEYGRQNTLRDRTKIAVWLLQDSPEHKGRSYIERFCRDVEAQNSNVEFEIHDFTVEEIQRCIACDICPTEVGPPEEYRCIIKSPKDMFKLCHKNLLNADAILVGAYSPRDRKNILSVYQRFVERTRYLRRDDYVLGDMLIAPFIISEVYSNQNLHIRMLTSFVRHHTVLHHPLIGMEYEGEVLSWPELITQGLSFSKNAERLAIGKLLDMEQEPSCYNTIGYVISSEKKQEDILSGRQGAEQEGRRESSEKKMLDRLVVEPKHLN